MPQKENLADHLLKTWATLHGTKYQNPVLMGQIETALILDAITPDEARELTATFIDNPGAEYLALQEFIAEILGV